MKTILEMAREADPKANLSEPYCLDPETRAWLERFAALVREEALAQPEQEPVALEDFIKWDEDIDPIGEVVGFIEDNSYIMVKVHDGKQVSLNDDLYATPPQRTWVELTFAEICECESEYLNVFARAIEAKLKEKNT